DDLLRRRKRREHLGAHGFFLYGFDELLSDAEMHVRLEQRDTNFAEGGLHVLRREFPFSAQIFKNALELIAKILKHELPLNGRVPAVGRCSFIVAQKARY